MTICTIYDVASGRILRTMDLPDEVEAIEANIDTAAGEMAIEGDYPSDQYYVVDDEPVAFPPQPNRWHRWNWDTKAWEGYMTFQEIQTILRAEASLPKLEFLRRCIDLEIFDLSEASSLAMNVLGPNVQYLIDQIPSEATRETALMEWASKTVITRNDELVIAIALAGLVEQKLDDVFGITEALNPAP